MTASIIITTYNRPTYLKRAVESALYQRADFPCEVIVVDDNGLGTAMQEETEGLVKSQFPDVVYLPLKQNSGACIARNQGATIASGTYLFFLDDDDVFLPNKVQHEVSYLDNHPELAGCLAAFRRLDEKGSEIESDSNQPVVGDFKNFVLHGNFFTPMLCIRKEAFVDSGGFISIPRFQDRFYMLNALRKGLRFGVIPEPLHIMYEHSGSRLTSSSVGKTSEALLQINNFVLDYRDEFSSAEWQAFQRAQSHTLAVTRYNAAKRSIRRSASLDYLHLFLSQPNLADFIMVFKSLVK